MSGAPVVKTESPDEAEIRELAEKMVEANRAKMQAQARIPLPSATLPSLNLLSFFNRTTENQDDETDSTLTPNDLGDDESIRGRFGWTTIGKSHIPYITRSGEKYCAVRIIELTVLSKYLAFLHQDIFSCTCIKSFYVTEAECRLLNEINMRHCECQFGREQFTLRDLIVRLTDSIEFYRFLDSCYNKLLFGLSNATDRCGFIRINKDSVVPFTCIDKEKYVPLFYFEGETDNLKLKSEKLEGWNLSYLKFCCKVQGIRNELFAHDSCSVIALVDIKGYFPPGTTFEDYWPSKVPDSQLLANGKSPNNVAQWTRLPSHPPMTSTLPPPSPKPATQAKAAVSGPLTFSPSYASYGLQGPPPAYPPLQPRTASSALRASYPTPSTSNRPLGHYYGGITPTVPPLIRAAQPYPLYGKDSWSQYTNHTTIANYNMMLGEAMQAYRQAVPPLQKYPPLSTSRYLNGAGIQYDVRPLRDHYSAAEIVDLSSVHRLQQEPPVFVNQQPAHQQAPHNFCLMPNSVGYYPATE